MVQNAEAACFSKPEIASLKVETLPFKNIPHQSKLFLDYLEDPAKLNKFYPNAVHHHHELSKRKDQVLKAHKTDRNVLCEALSEMNKSWNASEKTLANIERLRGAETVAVVTGQQAGLFTGPLYTIYKALSAVKLANCLNERGVSAVPVFWIATEDHDYAEVATAEFIGCDCHLVSVTSSETIHREGHPVGNVVLNESIKATADELFQNLPDTEFISELEALIENSYKAGISYSDAFAQMLTALLGEYGLIFLDPQDEKLKKLSAPIYSKAAGKADELVPALMSRSKELETAGYHTQVLITPDSFPLFYHTKDGARRALTKTEPGKYRAKGTNEEFSVEELMRLTENEPQRFSPNVTLRAVVQDYLLPTIAYFGGAAEIAYFAQNEVVYHLLERPVTTILPRASLTVVETRTQRTLNRYEINFTDLFEGYEKVLTYVVEKHLSAETAKAFDKTELAIVRELDSLKEALAQIEPTLAEALEKGRRKIDYQLNGLRTRFHRAQLKRDEATQRQIERAFASLYPNKALQERHICIISLIARHGKYAVQWIHDAMNLGTNEHQIVYL